MEYTAVINKIDNWWVGWIKEIPGVNCQEDSRTKLLESLKITLKEALEFNKQDALAIAGEGYEEEPIMI
jgi:predicted RNase H-like HicB family nuclease